LNNWSRGRDSTMSNHVAFQTNEFQRLKIGVAPDEEQHVMAAYLVNPFSSKAAAIMESAIKVATDRILAEMKAASRSCLESAISGFVM
jgi:peptidyl-tRNA hydrolase